MNAADFAGAIDREGLADTYCSAIVETPMRRIGPALIAILACFFAVAATDTGTAQNSGAAADTGTRLITLGTVAGPPPRPHRAQSSNLLIVNKTLYVIDAGDGVARRIAKAGFNVRDVGTIFITHHHDDHTAGLGTLMSTAWDNQRTTPINVYGPPRTEELVKAAVQYFSISAEIRIADGGRTIPIERLFFGHDVGTGLVYQDANIKVTAIENTHFAFHTGPAAGKHKSYSYRFETPDRVVVFSGDTGPSTALTELAKGADLLVTEVTNSVEETKGSRSEAAVGSAIHPPSRNNSFATWSKNTSPLKRLARWQRALASRPLCSRIYRTPPTLRTNTSASSTRRTSTSMAASW